MQHGIIALKGRRSKRMAADVCGFIKAAYPELAKELERRLAGDLPDQWDAAVMDAVCQAAEAAETVATRKASQKALNALAPAPSGAPWRFG